MGMGKTARAAARSGEVADWLVGGGVTKYFVRIVRVVRSGRAPFEGGADGCK